MKNMKNLVLLLVLATIIFSNFAFSEPLEFDASEPESFADGQLTARSLDPRRLVCPPRSGICPNGFCCNIKTAICCRNGCCRRGQQCVLNGCCPRGFGACPNSRKCCPLGSRCLANGRCLFSR